MKDDSIRVSQTMKDDSIRVSQTMKDDSIRVSQTMNINAAFFLLILYCIFFEHCIERKTYFTNLTMILIGG